MTRDAQELDLAPSFVALKWYKGRTPTFTVQAKDTAGDAIDLTGATAKMELKNASGTVVLTLQTGGSGIVVSSPSSGILTISPEAVGTSSLPVGNVLTTDLKVTYSDSTVHVFFRGTVTLIDKVTA